MRKWVVLSVGGSVIVPDTFNLSFIKKFKRLILQYVKRGYGFIIVAGGGKTARKYQKAAKALGVKKQQDLDWIGIQATKGNAHLLRSFFGKHAYASVIDNPVDLPKRSGKAVIFASGWKPGCSTDYDAVLLAEKIGAKTIVNLSNIMYAYDKDPKKYKSAKKLTTVSWNDFQKIVGVKWSPGMNKPFDPVATKRAAKLGLTVVIMKGTALLNLKRFLNGGKCKGTIIS